MNSKHNSHTIANLKRNKPSTKLVKPSQTVRSVMSYYGLGEFNANMPHLIQRNQYKTLDYIHNNTFQYNPNMPRVTSILI